MYAIQMHEFGEPDELRWTELPDPAPGDSEVLLDVTTAGVNRVDLLFRSGLYHREDVDFVSAAALPTAWLSAWYCLHRLAAIGSADTLLVHAAASGVGSAAAQIGKHAGATVFGTASTAEKRNWVRQLGADEVLDLVGGDAFAASLHAAARAGRVLAMAMAMAMANVALAPSTIDTRDFYPRNVSIFGFQITDLMQHGWDPRADLRELLDAVAARRFTVPVYATYSVRRAADAHRRLASRQVLGKVVLSTP